MLELVVDPGIIPFDYIGAAARALQSWPVVNGFFIITIAFCSIYVMRRGDRDRKSGGGNVEIPAYLMGGPVHDAMGAIHDMAEESRTTNGHLGRLMTVLTKCADEQRQQTQLLEFIRNNQEMRGDPQPPPNQQRLKRGV